VALTSQLIKVALNEVGYLEKASNKSLDSKTANAGSKNFTKYARDLDNIDGFYNGKKNGYAWCDVFVDWCFVTAFGVEKAKELLCQPSQSLGAGCGYSMNYYKNKGQFHSKPEIGDQIFFKSGSSIIHTGIVCDVDSKYVYTVEGNTSGASGVVSNGGGVCKKKYKLTSSYIAGYGRPAYDKEEVITYKPTVFEWQKAAIVDGFKFASGADGIWGKECEAVAKKAVCKKRLTYQYKNLTKIVQKVVGVTVDGKFGNDTKNAVIKFQELFGLVPDGCVGINTWKKILGVK
jgi:peptidoglycan hydrolase-like protein with peptidoglycan-binding domain